MDPASRDRGLKQHCQLSIKHLSKVLCSLFLHSVGGGQTGCTFGWIYYVMQIFESRDTTVFMELGAGCASSTYF
jgi:hypothetical protein